MSQTAKKYNRITRILTQALAGRDFPTHARGYEMNIKTQELEPTVICMADVIQRVLENKIISKSEVDALRRDKYVTDCKYQSIVAELAGARSENLKLKQENTNLKIDNFSMKAYSPVYWLKDTNWSEYNVKFTTTPALPTKPIKIGGIISADLCDICQKLDPPNATHGHSDFEKFVRRLKFWR